MYPPFWFSTLKSKIGYAHITGRNLRSKQTLKSLVISPKALSQKQIGSLFSWFSQHPPQQTACLCTTLFLSWIFHLLMFIRFNFLQFLGLCDGQILLLNFSGMFVPLLHAQYNTIYQPQPSSSAGCFLSLSLCSSSGSDAMAHGSWCNVSLNICTISGWSWALLEKSQKIIW